jgi:hypothetical protein
MRRFRVRVCYLDRMMLMAGNQANGRCPVDGLEVESYLLEQSYSVWANNCQHYAKQLTVEIVTRQP